jgi:hypothetical protein
MWPSIFKFGWYTMCRVMVGLLLLGMVSCASVKRIEEDARRLQSQINQETVAAHNRASVVTIDWSEAAAMARRHNARICAAKLGRDVQLLELKQRWKDQLPQINLSLSTFDLLQRTTEGWGYALFAYLGLPDYMHYSQTRIASALSVRRAELNLRLVERQVLRELYLLFCEDSLLGQEEELDALVREWHSGLVKQIRLDGQEDGWSMQLKERRRRWQLALCEALGQHTVEWRLLSHTRPAIPNEIPSPENAVARGFDNLAMCLNIIDWEAVRLKGLGARISKWPSIYPYFTAPSLYDSSGRITRNQGLNFGVDVIWPLTELLKMPERNANTKMETGYLQGFIWQARARRLQELESWRIKLAQLRIRERISVDLAVEVGRMPTPATAEELATSMEYWARLIMSRLAAERAICELTSMWWMCDEQWWAGYDEI